MWASRTSTEKPTSGVEPSFDLISAKRCFNLSFTKTKSICEAFHENPFEQDSPLVHQYVAAILGLRKTMLEFLINMVPPWALSPQQFGLIPLHGNEIRQHVSAYIAQSFWQSL